MIGAVAPGASVASTNRSAVLPGPSTMRLSRARNGSDGWPSIAMTCAAWRSSRTVTTRALAALTSRRRSRSLACTGKVRGGGGVGHEPAAARLCRLELALGSRGPFVEDQHVLTIDRDRAGLIDNEDAVKPPAGLLRRIVRRVPCDALYQGA